jgi:cell wall-associated NlpC family hydrolase
MDSRLNKPLVLAMVAIALVLGLLVGMTTGVTNWLFGGPNPKTIASASLESMRAQNRLIAFTARYVSVTTSTQSQLGFSAKRTLILPGDVRYELDLSKLQPSDVTWDASSKTLRVKLPEIEIAGPDVDLAAAQEYGQGGILSALTNANQQLDSANRAKAVATCASRLRARCRCASRTRRRVPRSSAASRCRLSRRAIRMFG